MVLSIQFTMNSTKTTKNTLSRKKQHPAPPGDQSDSSDCSIPVDYPPPKKENLRLSDNNYRALQPFLSNIRNQQETLLTLERKSATLTRDLSDLREPRLTALRKQPPSLPTPLVHDSEFLAKWQASLLKSSRKLAKLTIETIQKQSIQVKKEIAQQRQQAFASIEKFEPEEDRQKASTLFPKLVDGQNRRLQRHRGPPPAKKRKL